MPTPLKHLCKKHILEIKKFLAVVIVVEYKYKMKLMCDQVLGVEFIAQALAAAAATALTPAASGAGAAAGAILTLTPVT